MGKARAVILAVALSLGTASGSWGQAEETRETSEFAQFLGSYELAAPEKAQSIISRAISAGTDDMGPLRRSIARKRLRATNRAYQSVRILEEHGNIVTNFDDRRYVAPANGRAQRGKDPEGKRVDVSYRVEGRVLHGRYVGEDGEKRIDFELSPDGESMTFAVTVLSDQLPAPIRYQIAYERD